MGREYFAPSNESLDEEVVKYFLPIRLVAQLRRLIGVLEAKNKTDQQTMLALKDAIEKRSEKIGEYQDRIRRVYNQINN